MKTFYKVDDLNSKIHSTVESDNVSYVFNAKIEDASIRVDEFFNVCFYIKFIYSEGTVEYEMVLSNSNDEQTYLTPTDNDEGRVIHSLTITSVNENFSALITYLLNTTESDCLEDLKDKYVRIGLDKFSGVSYIGNIINNRWISLKEFA